MNKAPFILSAAAAAAFAAFGMTEPAQAKTAAEWTCSEFLQVPKHARPHVVYFMSALHNADKLKSADIAPKDFNQSIKEVVTYCEKNRPQSLWDAIVNHFYWKAMQMP